jgi:uncharacterized protein YbbC (DUF1343 family)
LWPQRAIAALGLNFACGSGAPENNGSEALAPRVLPGIDVLLEERLSELDGQRVGLITNHTGLTADSLSSIDAMVAAGVDLVALFGPEHGLRGLAEAGEHVDSAVDSVTGLPIRSLYGATRAPTPEMLADIDILIFDIQDIGTRYYTYVWTMALAMQAAAEQNKQFIVLDRPNPIGGHRVDGNVLDTAFASFVGLYPVPMRHGMTAGELARMVNAEFGVNASLTVVPVRGWTRTDWYDTTALPWVPTSPNMPTLESAAHYPGTCLVEGTNLSVSRGTHEAFRQIGAPWLDTPRLVQRLRERNLPGVAFDTASMTPVSPGDGKYDGELLRALRFTVMDRESYDPSATALIVLEEIRSLQPDVFEFNPAGFDRLAGTDRIRLDLMAGVPAATIMGGWTADRDRFLAMRARYLLYP